MKKNVWIYVIGVYVVCYVFRLWEYFGLRADQTIIGEAFIHKIIGIVILIIAMKQLHYNFADIGLKKRESSDIQHMAYCRALPHL